MFVGNHSTPIFVLYTHVLQEVFPHQRFLIFPHGRSLNYSDEVNGHLGIRLERESAMYRSTYVFHVSCTRLEHLPTTEQFLPHDCRAPLKQQLHEQYYVTSVRVRVQPRSPQYLRPNDSIQRKPAAPLRQGSYAFPKVHALRMEAIICVVLE